MIDVSPKFHKKAFQCPHCHEIEVQEWANEEDFLSVYLRAQRIVFYDYRETIQEYKQTSIEAFLNSFSEKRNLFRTNGSYDRAECAGCKQISIWVNKKMVYPLTPSAPNPSDDMPDSVKKVYEEARLVEPYSKRAAMVLLRVSLEKLMENQEIEGKTLHEKIKNLAKKGVTDEAIRWLLAVKHLGNEAAHIGDIEPNDEEVVKNVSKMFTTINLVVTIVITQKKVADDLTKGQANDDEQTEENTNP